METPYEDVFATHSDTLSVSVRDQHDPAGPTFPGHS
jgi:hypothetical protein